MERRATSTARGTVGSQHGHVWGFLMRSAINPFMRRALRSRFHRQIGSDMMMVLSFQGRKSGKCYAFPIGYMQVGSQLVCYSPFGWWTNLQGGTPVTVTLRGKQFAGTADVCTETAAIAAGMADYLRHNPGDAFFFRIKVGKDRELLAADVQRAAGENVEVRISLNDATVA